MHRLHRGAARCPAASQGSPEGPRELPLCPQGSSPPCSWPTWYGAAVLHLGSFIPSSAGAAEPALELIESLIRGRDGDLKAAHRYFIIQPNKDMLA